VIFTARVYVGGSHTSADAEVSRQAIRQWCMEQFGQELEVTCEKDPDIEEIWDDRAVRVEKNTGEPEFPELVGVSRDILESMEW